MGVVDRINNEVRTLGGVPWQPWQNPYWKFSMGGPVHPYKEVGGIDQVVGLAAVYACVRFIADAVASLPINVYRNTPNGPQRLPQSQLFTNPSADLNTTLYDWIFQCVASTLLWGNAWGMVSSRTGVSSPGGLGYPQTIEWLPPDAVSVQDDAQQPWNSMKAKIYLGGQEIDRSNLVHVRAFVVPGRLEAISPMRAFATLYQQGLSALDYSSTWFRNGGFPPGTFQNLAEEVDGEQAREIRQRLTDTLRTHQPLVYGKDWDYKPVVVPPNEAAFVEAMQLNATQVAAIYGVPPTKVGGRRGDSLTYATVEQETISLLSDTLRPWLVRMEHLFTSLLPQPQFARFDTDDMHKTDLKTRADIYRIQRDIGLVTIDEMRQKEDLPPLPGKLGGETIPLDTLTRMASTTRAVPTTMLPQLTFEAEVIAELLQKFADQNLTVPEKVAQVMSEGGGPLPVTPSQQPTAGATGTPVTPAPAAPGGSQPPGQGKGGGGGIVQGPLTYLGHQLTLGRSNGDRGDEVQGYFGYKHHRATLADRDRAGRWVDDAAASGCLDEHEYEERIAKVARARIRGQLDELVKDLPPENELAPPQEAGGSEDGTELPPLFGPQALALLQGRDPALLNGSH